MKTESIANRYASGLFLLAKEHNQISLFNTQLKAVVLALNENQQIIEVLNHYQILDEDKFKIVDQVFGKELEPTLINFLKLILQKRRFNHIIKIVEEFSLLVNESLGVKAGIVYSSIPLNANQIKDITTTLEKVHGVTAELKNLVDTALIGGYKIVVGDTVFDGSIRNRLEVMRQELNKRK